MISKIHMIIAHPNPNSFNHALLEEVKKLAYEHELSLAITDLYQLAIDKHPLVNFYGLDSGPINGALTLDEQRKFKEAELIIVQFPMYWFSYPAIVHAYLEQLWQPGFAYPPTFEESPLACDKKSVLFSVTTQSPKSAYTNQGKNGDIARVLFPMTTAFRFVGHSILEPFVAYAVSDQSDDKRRDLLKDYKAHVSAMLSNPKVIMTANTVSP